MHVVVINISASFCNPFFPYKQLHELKLIYSDLLLKFINGNGEVYYKENSDESIVCKSGEYTLKKVKTPKTLILTVHIMQMCFALYSFITTLCVE
ncbi:hypothetical protein T08_9182 [Trichinella sp. T8]|nr:hypothetical protein T08_9182 [Trichinella sp. T8]